MSEAPKDIMLLVDLGAGVDNEKLDDTTTQLLQDLNDLELIRSRKASSEKVLQGAKAGEISLIGQIIISIVGGTIPALIQFLTDWLSRHKRDVVTIKLVYGDEALELTYNPQQISDTEIEAKVKKFQTLLES
jgi:hypothetical protein